ncbi:hypothetical protein R1flu_025186 [Riccia fluitans]|uniref:Uncharacterized protein n=1 Tax=Riccia fluitans TaxID=41844 RepID=A0ABD1XX25_9MARC
MPAMHTVPRILQIIADPRTKAQESRVSDRPTSGRHAVYEQAYVSCSRANGNFGSDFGVQHCSTVLWLKFDRVTVANIQ